MLRDIQDYMKNRRHACLSEIAAHLDAAPSAIAPMLELLAARGRIRRLVAQSQNCGACTKCSPDALIVWEWVE